MPTSPIISSEAVEEAEEALRKLSRDLATYRDPAVRRHLQSLPTNSSDGPRLSSETPAQLKAMIISLRTQLHESLEAQKRTDEDALEARKRAAKAEAEVKELNATLVEKNSQHEAVVKNATERIQALEEEKIHAAQSASDRALILQETLERDRLGNKSIIAERDKYQSQLSEAMAKISELQRELSGVEERQLMEKRALMREKDAAGLKIAGLEEELKYLEGSLRGGPESAEELLCNRTRSTKLQRETVLVRTELANQSKEVVVLKDQLAESQSMILSLQGQLRKANSERSELLQLREKVEQLRKDKRKSENASHHVSALVREKQELTRLISNLSPTGDVQQGLQILRSSVLKGQTLETREANTHDGFLANKHQEEIAAAEARHQAELARQKMTVKGMEKRKQDLENRLVQARAERDLANSSNKRNERIRRILEHEKTYFKAALEKIETDFDKVPDPGGFAERLQERCDAYEKFAKDYESALKEVEQRLDQSRKKIEALTTEVAAAKEFQQSIAAAQDSADSVKSQLMRAMKTANEAIAAKEAAVEAAKKATTRLSSVETELRQLKLHREKESGRNASEVDLDFDPSVTKVLHLRENLLAEAMKEARAELEKSNRKKRMRTEGEAMSPVQDAPNDETRQSLLLEIQELKTENAKLSKSSKVGVRTGEIAKRKIEEVRAAVYNLFGWSMRVMGAKYSIGSIYAEGPEDVLEFGMNESGTMTLLETGYTARLVDEIEQYVQKMNSIPALLASITMENFEKTTTAFV